MLSRSSSAAISAMGVLAQSHAAGEGPLTAVEIGRRCGVQGPFVAKLLVELSRQGLVVGARGRRGGYGLAREPGRIVLSDVTRCFERADKHEDCPFGFGACGRNPVCPLHQKVEPVRRALQEFLQQTSFAEYLGAAPEVPKAAPSRAARVPRAPRVPRKVPSPGAPRRRRRSGSGAAPER